MSSNADSKNTRRSLNEAPLDIENLPSRILNGDCKVLPPTFRPPEYLPKPMLPYPSCGTGGIPYCPAPCFFPPPCTPWMCQPPPCCPLPCCPQPSCPPPCCSPPCCPPKPCCCPPPPPRCCPPSPPCPPKCCPPRPMKCPPPPCIKCCSPCGMSSGGCCSGPKQIICIPKPKLGDKGSTYRENKNKNSAPNPSFDQPASYNNCNFYLTSVPKGLQDKFGMMMGQGSVASEDDCADEVSVDVDCEEPNQDDDECSEDNFNPAGGDDRVFQPPVGYPNSERTPWATGGVGGETNSGGRAGSSNSGGGIRRGRGSSKSGSSNSRNVRRNVIPDDCDDQQYTGAGATGGYNSAGGYNNSRGGGGYNNGGNYNQTSGDPNRDIVWGDDPCLSDRVYRNPEDYRDYLYDDEELTAKPEAYRPENYPVPPPHTFNRKIHPLRAPILPASGMATPARNQKGNQNYSRGAPNPAAYDNCEEETVQYGRSGTRAPQTSANYQTYYGGQYDDSCSEIPRNPTNGRSNYVKRGYSAPNLSQNDDCEDIQQVFKANTFAHVPTKTLGAFNPQEDCAEVDAAECEELIAFKKDVMTDGKTRKKRNKKFCIRPHARRLHRLCSFSNRRSQRLSDVHKPMLNMAPPPCPIRETVASILKKKPPVDCRWHDKEIPAFHEFCMTDHCPDTNRYPLLTRMDCDGLPTTYDAERDRQQVEKRGAKRRNHHRY